MSAQHPKNLDAAGACSFDKLVHLVDKQLCVDDQLRLFSHLDSCSICRDAVYQISRDRDSSFFLYRTYNVRKHVA
jgi:hypothetical protein